MKASEKTGPKKKKRMISPRPAPQAKKFRKGSRSAAGAEKSKNSRAGREKGVAAIETGLRCRWGTREQKELKRKFLGYRELETKYRSTTETVGLPQADDYKKKKSPTAPGYKHKKKRGRVNSAGTPPYEGRQLARTPKEPPKPNKDPGREKKTKKSDIGEPG